MPLIYVKQSSSDAFVACESFAIQNEVAIFTPEGSTTGGIELEANDQIRFDSPDVALQFYNWLQTVAEQII